MMHKRFGMIPFGIQRSFIRLNSSTIDSCTTAFHPTSPFASTFKHIHIKGITPYLLGNQIQENLISRNLDYKKYSITSKNVRKLANDSEESNITPPPRYYPTIFTFEFESTYTGGKREKVNTSDEQKQNYESLKHIPFVQTSRGGQITYHGPGQVVIYPIIDLSSFSKLNSKCYVSTIEKSVVGLLRNKFELDALTTENTGVWVKCKGTEDDLRKISSLGVNVRRSITSHGVSINCSIDLSYVNDKRIVMCGLKEFYQTSIENEIGKQVTVEDVGKYFVGEFTNRLGVQDIDYHEAELSHFNNIENFNDWVESVCIYQE